MNVNKKTSSVLLVFFLGTVGSQHLFAEKVPTKVTFETMNEKMSPIKPGTLEEKIKFPNELDPTEKGVIQLLHAPKFYFGDSNKIKIEDATYFVKYEEVALVSNPNTSFYLPPFVQVGDGSGKDTKWRVKVSQSSPFESTEGSRHCLPKTRIKIHEGSLTNNVKQVEVGTILQDGNYQQPKTIPLTSDDELTVLSANSGTNGTISSAVFQNNYDEKTYGPGKTINEMSRMEGVQLHVPRNEKVFSMNYQTALSWTLEVGP
ncbi:WxL domain-containing protein [Vagococcus silagei]|uniref:WxL domain-containing protein n=1 Tax=Vagococcus silagei TaxID=2508885 RepID=A0A4S3B6M4_9ENTE|nr:WxL domain-containing protein [Vagococcus silagei]THB62288.1 WxL domain-containing protein [Vagococcus silagei]